MGGTSAAHSTLGKAKAKGDRLVSSKRSQAGTSFAQHNSSSSERRAGHRDCQCIAKRRVPALNIANHLLCVADTVIQQWCPSLIVYTHRVNQSAEVIEVMQNESDDCCDCRPWLQATKYS